jgi:hypothetical protein
VTSHQHDLAVLDWQLRSIECAMRPRLAADAWLEVTGAGGGPQNLPAADSRLSPRKLFEKFLEVQKSNQAVEVIARSA